MAQTAEELLGRLGEASKNSLVATLEGKNMKNSFRRFLQTLNLTAKCIALVVGGLVILSQGNAAQTVTRAGSLRIYIELQNGFESYIAAAIVKKHVPAVVTQNKDEATFVVTSAVESKEESGGSKVARCLFLYCAGIQGVQTATVQLVDSKTQEVAWAYNVQKGSAGAYQSTAESIAKHLKEFLEKHPQ